jgi:hypothetical protein
MVSSRVPIFDQVGRNLSCRHSRNGFNFVKYRDLVYAIKQRVEVAVEANTLLERFGLDVVVVGANP